MRTSTNASSAERLAAFPHLEHPDHWRAVEARDAASDGRFVYAVRSTHIYCRPSCPSRRPRPQQVTFFADPAAAERAGYRACRRCHPREASAHQQWAEMVARACAHIEHRLPERVALAELSRVIGYSPFHLQRAFKRITGVTPRQFGEARRVERLKRGLRKGEPIVGATLDAGFGSPSRAYALSGDGMGMTPGSYRRGGAHARIRYAIGASPLGRLLLAATDRGVCAVRLGGTDRALLAELTLEFPAADIRRDERGLAAWMKAAREQVSGVGPGTLDLPLDVRATAFQSRVWRALRSIPRGETRSYSEVARALGRASASRAVACACATNPVAVLIPCHRVVRRDGSAGGYRWGVRVKQRLLERERRAPRRASTARARRSARSLPSPPRPAR